MRSVVVHQNHYGLAEMISSFLSISIHLMKKTTIVEV